MIFPVVLGSETWPLTLSTWRNSGFTRIFLRIKDGNKRECENRQIHYEEVRLTTYKNP